MPLKSLRGEQSRGGKGMPLYNSFPPERHVGTPVNGWRGLDDNRKSLRKLLDKTPDNPRVWFYKSTPFNRTRFWCVKIFSSTY